MPSPQHTFPLYLFSKIVPNAVFLLSEIPLFLALKDWKSGHTLIYRYMYYRAMKENGFDTWLTSQTVCIEIVL